MKNKYLLVIISVSILLSSCQGAQDAREARHGGDEDFHRHRKGAEVEEA